MEIIIKVFRFSNGIEKEVYRNTIKVPVGVSFSYDYMTESLRWLYPGCMITYTL